ncbi:phosphatidylcholine transfer protein isoform X3 [Arvicanthis niloticus]|uniref:phosphatidylcholine transfer protein isoform X3 n=1 Tax=Arvicanthis niloticus TaxID=61156 RepID=UPI0014861847|nr:phosphatidylcholine transfer protein isoform X1 [Arvicanthis niloticus]
MAGATGSFSDQQFREACAEIQQPALAGADWQLLVEASGITIYRLLDQPSGLYEYKVFGVLEGCLPALLADVYMDLDYRKKWDPYVKELYEKACDGQMVAYWEVKYPFPLSNRDYVYTRQRRDLDVDGRKIYVVLAQSISVPQFPEKSGVIRVKQYKQSLAIESDGKKGSREWSSKLFEGHGESVSELPQENLRKGLGPQHLWKDIFGCATPTEARPSVHTSHLQSTTHSPSELASVWIHRCLLSHWSYSEPATFFHY